MVHPSSLAFYEVPHRQWRDLCRGRAWLAQSGAHPVQPHGGYRLYSRSCLPPWLVMLVHAIRRAAGLTQRAAHAASCSARALDSQGPLGYARCALSCSSLPPLRTSASSTSLGVEGLPLLRATAPMRMCSEQCACVWSDMGGTRFGRGLDMVGMCCVLRAICTLRCRTQGSMTRWV